MTMSRTMHTPMTDKAAPIIDFHSHVLPLMDDGSRSVQESLEMLQQSYSQGVRYMVASPHYFPWQEDPEKFLLRRAEAYNRLCDEVMAVEHPQLLLGAEVSYYDGIGFSQQIKNLTISGTNLMMIEMPMVPWTSRMLDDLDKLQRRNIRIILAHIERYIELQKGTDNLKRIFAGDCIIQSNANFFIRPKTQKYALKLFKNNKIQVLGSDCHNTDSRPPNIGNAIAVLRDNVPKYKFNDFIKANYNLFKTR